MEVVGAVSAIAGIASFGLQLAQQLQKQIGEVREAEERVNDLVLELQATSNNLDKIKSLLSSAENTTSQKYALNERFHDDLKFLIGRCEVIFRNIVRLLAKAGSLALSKVDSFLRPFKQNRVSDSNPDLKLEIEFLKLSAGDRSLWSFRRPKIEQYIADLGRLKSELTLLLLIASLTRTVPDGDLNVQASALQEPGDATTLVDEIYYTNQALGNTDKESDNPHTERSMSVNSGDDNSDSDDTSVSGSSSIGLLDSTAMQLFKKSAVLFLNWPLSTTDDVPTLEFLLEHNIFFEAYAINISGTAYEHTKLPLPNRLLYERALQFSRSTEKNIMDIISELPFAQQKILERTLRQIDPKSKSRSSVVQLSGPVVVNLELHNHTRKVTRLHKFRAFFSSQNPEVQVQCMTFTILRFEILNDEEELDEELELNDENEKVKEQRQERAQAEREATEEAAKRAEEAAAKKEEESHAALWAAVKSLPPSPDRKEPIQLTDAVGRKFSFPFEVACKWENMEKFIQQAFKNVEDLSPHVSEGRYDLIDSSKRIILPLLWDATVYPGIAIKQMMWPLPQPHRQPPGMPAFSYGPPPPAPGVTLRPGQTGRPRPPNHPPPPMPTEAGGLGRPSHPPPQPPFKREFTILPNQASEFAKKRQTRPREEKLAWMTIPVGPGAPKVAPQVTDRIADYKPKAPQKTDLEDKAQEDVVPSDDVKEEVMRHYLKKWTTGSGRSDEQERERTRSTESDERRLRTDRRARMSSVESEERTSSVHRRGRESSTHSTKRKSSEHSKDRSPIADSGGEAAHEVQDD